jgi:hypothetical protein
MWTPVPAKAFYFYGIPRCCGGFYAICIDCDPDNPQFISIDAVNATDNGKNPPVGLLRSSNHPSASDIDIDVLAEHPLRQGI